MTTLPFYEMPYRPYKQVSSFVSSKGTVAAEYVGIKYSEGKKVLKVNDAVLWSVDYLAPQKINSVESN